MGENIIKTLLLCLVFALSASIFSIQSCNLKQARQTIAEKENAINNYKGTIKLLEKELDAKECAIARFEAEKSAITETHIENINQIQKVKDNDELVKDWCNSIIPDSIAGILRNDNRE